MVAWQISQLCKTKDHLIIAMTELHRQKRISAPSAGKDNYHGWSIW